MSCNSPNMMLKVLTEKFGVNYLKNKKFIVEKDGEFSYKFLGKADKFCDYDIKKFTDYGELVQVPCGRCIACRLDYSKMWASRCMCEAKLYQFNYFITLTYDNDHVPKNSLGNNTLRPDDMSKFIRSLRQIMKRKYNCENIRFFGCGEYGSSTLRPHMHLLVFNCPLQDLDVKIPYVDEETGEHKFIYKNDIKGQPLMFSQDVSDAWQHKGNVIIGGCEWQSCAYVARYICKKQYGEGAEFYKIFDLVPEFIRSSNRPGIGLQYMVDNLDRIYEVDSLLMLNNDYVMKNKPPRYFDKRLKYFKPNLYDAIKLKRENFGIEQSKLKFSTRCGSIQEDNLRNEHHLLSCLSSLLRL